MAAAVPSAPFPVVLAAYFQFAVPCLLIVAFIRILKQEAGAVIDDLLGNIPVEGFEPTAAVLAKEPQKSRSSSQ